MGENVTFQNVNQVMLEVLDQMYLACAGIAVLILFLSVYRNYREFGEYLGIRYLIGLLLTVVLLLLFPQMADYLFKGMLNWGRDAGKRVEEIIELLKKVEVEGGWLSAMITGIANLCYQGAIGVGGFLRDIMICRSYDII